MTNRWSRIGLAALLGAALSAGAAQAQKEDQDADDDSDPCADAEDPCGGETRAEPSEGEGGGGEGETGGEEPAVDDSDTAVAAEAGASMGPTIPAGKIALTAALQVGFSAEDVGGEAGNPLSIAPDVWYGINNSLSAGIVTSIHGVTGFWGGAIGGLAGTGLCLSGEPDLAEGVIAGCNNTFDNAGLEGMYALASGGSLRVALDAGIHAIRLDPGEDIDPFIDAKLGLRGMWRSGKIGVGFAPSLFFALTERGDPPDGANNNDQLFLPVDVGFMVTPALALGVQSGIAGSLQNFGEDYVVPVALGGVFNINAKMVLAAAFSLDRVTGGTPEGVEDTSGAADRRSFSLVFGYML
jgi:hypothetical protein